MNALTPTRIKLHNSIPGVVRINPRSPKAFLRSNGWKAEGCEWRRKGSGCTDSLHEAIAAQVLNDAVRYLIKKGWRVTCASHRDVCDDPKCPMLCPRCWFASVLELRDPTYKHTVRSWRNAVRRQLERDSWAIRARSALRLIRGGAA